MRITEVNKDRIILSWGPPVQKEVELNRPQYIALAATMLEKLIAASIKQHTTTPCHECEQNTLFTLDYDTSTPTLVCVRCGSLRECLPGMPL